MHANVTPLHVTTENTAQRAHMSEPTLQLAAPDTDMSTGQTDRHTDRELDDEM